MEGIAVSEGLMPSFPTILSQHGETLHNHKHDGILTDGKLIVIDAGAESNTNYCSDFTRTIPSSGKFTTKQKEIYDIVGKEKFDSILTVITPVIGISRLGLSSHKNVYEVFRKYMPEDDFDRLPKPLTVCATDLITSEGRYFDSGKHLHDAVLASSSIPGVFEAVKIDSGVYVDGGLIDNLPAKAIRKDCECLIGVDVNPSPLEPPKLENKADLISQTMHTIVHHSSKEGRSLCDFVVEPRVSDRFNEFSFKEFKEICNIGHDTTADFIASHPEAAEKMRGLKTRSGHTV